METNNFMRFLPIDLLDDSPTQAQKKDFNHIFNYDQSTNYTSANNDSIMNAFPTPIKYKSSQELSNEEIIKRQLQAFGKKKMSDYVISRTQMFPQKYNKQDVFQYQQPVIMGTIQTGMPHPYMFISPKVRTVQSSKNTSFNLLSNQVVRMNKKFPTALNCNYNYLQCDYDEMLPEMTLKQVINQTSPFGFMSLIKTSKGSRMIQRKLNTITGDEIDLILSSLLSYLKELMCDYYGNYFLQKFFMYCNSMQRVLIYKNIQANFNEIAQDSCGTHSVQRLITLGNTKEEEAIIKEYLEGNLLGFSLQDNSTHIIKKVICSIPEVNRDYINNFIISNLVQLSCHSSGICIVKAFISSNQSEDLSELFIGIIELDTVELTCDQFGNYCIQETIKKFGYNRCNKIIRKISEKILFFSSMKFSSNVIDFLIRYTHSHNQESFNEITTNLFFNQSMFNEMTKNKYGNFVLENAIMLLDRSSLLKLKELMTVNGTLNLIKVKEKKIFKLIRNVKN